MTPMENPGEHVGASLAGGDSLENENGEEPVRNEKVSKPKKVKAKSDKEKRVKRDKSAMKVSQSQTCLLSLAGSDDELPPLAVVIDESPECDDSPPSPDHKQNPADSDIENVETHQDHFANKSPSKMNSAKSSCKVDKDFEEKRRMYDMLQAITDSYKGIQHRLDIVGDGVKHSAVFVQSNWRNVERLLIALLLIPAFVMSTLAIYRQSDKGYSFDLGEIQKEQLYYVALKNFDAWNEALISQDSSRISNLYATDLSFLPTMSDQFVVSARSEDKYFMHFVEQQPAGIIVEDKVQALGTDAYLHTGLYNFIIMSNYTASGFRQVHARFSFLWRSFDGAWKILHHHSSQMPSAFKCAPAPATDHAPEGDHTRAPLPTAANPAPAGALAT